MHTQHVTARLPVDLLADLDRLAEEGVRTRTQQMIYLMRRALAMESQGDTVQGEARTVGPVGVRLPVSSPVAGLPMGRHTVDVDPSAVEGLEPRHEGTEIRFCDGRPPVWVALPPWRVGWMLWPHGAPDGVGGGPAADRSTR